MTNIINNLQEELKEYMPRHIGIVMDGNGRWAKKRGLPRIMGHHEGVKTVERIVQAARDMGVRYLSLYAFSSENWKRPKSEVLGLMGLFRYYLKAKLARLNEERAKMRFAGRLGELPDDIIKLLQDAEETTKDNDGITVIVCINYGGRTEIQDAVSKLIAAKHEGPVDDEAIRRHLYLPDVPDPDLLIRTSGEYRMSNFWLYEGAYSEYYFSSLYWPDFDEAELERAIRDYGARERRYGDTGGKR